MSKLILTASRMDVKSRCDMRDFISYNLGYAPAKPSREAMLGSMVHRGLEYFWTGHSWRTALNGMKDWKYENRPDFWETDEGQLTALKAELYVEGYYTNYQESYNRDVADGKINDIQVEKEFRFSEGDIDFAGKIDVLYRDEYGIPVIIEHKTASTTASSWDSNYWNTLPMNIQLTIYRRATQRMYSAEDSLRVMPTVIYDVIVKSAKRKSQKRPYIKKGDFGTIEAYEEAKAANVESDQEYISRISKDFLLSGDQYKRKEILVTRDEQQKRFEEILIMEEQRPSWRKYEERVRNTSSCNDFGGCPFLQVCLGFEQLDSELFVLKEKTNSELSIVE